ncbi:hypothetical protein L4G92_07880 [Neisseria sp. ZJ106]|uniref:IgG-binding virulence factor TspB family protein n=1 Tax=Neisseria lisongii TaxID=2912188 RepID=A0ABY7RL16_9NEIS|nr:IgG-binding virulence factor TspB family protein [Neisseria lisongii]MCF7521962.1 hypothetical protein [Neisseria lisongii]WCL71336.1 IgG-binding virulence factor TspB family protein [Neisseria lisongii]WCL72330.1 IgG-binding virulence factor TspB family protein [Neisseria lisongii]
MRNLFLLIVLILFSPFIWADELHVSKKGNVTYVRQATSHWDSKPWTKTAISDNQYRKFQTQALKTRYESALSKKTVETTVTATVSRSAVLSGGLSVVKKGARIGLKAVPFVGAASLAYDAYTLYQAYKDVKNDIEAAGYIYDESADEFYKKMGARNCIWERYRRPSGYEDTVDVDCYPVSPEVIAEIRKGGEAGAKAKAQMEEEMRSLAEPYISKKFAKLIAKGDKGYGPGRPYSSYKLDKCEWSFNGGSCSVRYENDVRWPVLFTLYMKPTKEVLDSSKFQEIATAAIDRNPTPFIEAQNRPGYQESVSVAPNTSVEVETEENGQTQQVVITFSQDSQGRTISTVSVNGQSVSVSSGNQSGTSQPVNNQPVHSHPNSTESESRRNNQSNAAGKDGTDGKDGLDGKDGVDGKDGKDASLLCEAFPNISACQELGNVEERDIEIPEQQVRLELNPIDRFNQSAACPSPKTFELGLLGSFEVSYEVPCQVATLLRPILILITILSCGGFVYSAIKEL